MDILIVMCILLKFQIFTVKQIDWYLYTSLIILSIDKMTENKGMQIIDKLTRHHIFNSKYWKEECFALNA